jgi:hypothetical protein
MFPVEKPSMLNAIARGAMGENIPPGTVSLSGLLDENALDRIAETVGTKLWNGFLTFGSASAGVLAIMLIIRLIKLVVDTIIHGYALHSMYGWSIHLLGAIWSSVAHLLLHLGGRTTRPSSSSGTTEEAPTTLLNPITPSPSEDQHPTPKTRVTHKYTFVKEPTESDSVSYSALRRYLKEDTDKQSA